MLAKCGLIKSCIPEVFTTDLFANIVVEEFAEHSTCQFTVIPLEGVIILSSYVLKSISGMYIASVILIHHRLNWC